MEPLMTDDLETRLRGARPRAAQPDVAAFDAELLARVRVLPISSRRSLPRPVAVTAAGGTLAAAAAAMFVGAPGDVGGPQQASAIEQALHWLTPPAHTVLHVRNVERSGGQTTTREFWQSSDEPEKARMVEGGAHPIETSGDAFYDPSTNTIYDPFIKGGPEGLVDHGGKPVDGDKDAAIAAKEKAKEVRSEAAKPGGPSVRPAGGPPSDKPGQVQPRVGDPIIQKVRTLLGDDQMSVTGREVHDGVDTWKISLNPNAGRESWTLWVTAADGKPVELVDPGRGGNDGEQVIRWTTYEVLPDTDANSVTTLQGAHPDAHVVHDETAVGAAEARLFPGKDG